MPSFLMVGYFDLLAYDYPWAEPFDIYQEQREDVLLEDVVPKSKTDQTHLDCTDAFCRPFEPLVCCADGSLCVENVTLYCHDVKSTRRRSPDRKCSVVALRRAKGHPSSALGVDGWLDKRKNTITGFVNLMSCDSYLRWFVDVPQAEERVEVDNDHRFQSRFNSLCAGGQIGAKSLAPLLVCGFRMLETDNRTLEISRSAVAAGFNQEKGYVTYTGDSTWKRHVPSLASFLLEILDIRPSNGHDYTSGHWIEACFDAKPVGRSTFATSKGEYSSREANYLCPGVDTLLRRSGTGLPSVYSSLFHDLIAFTLVAPAAAFVITSWGLSEDFPLCTRDDSVWLPLGSIRAPTIAEFMLASIVYSITTTAYSLRRHKESLQGEILSVIVILNAVGGLWLNCDLQTIVLCIFPWAIIVALLLSSGLHSIAWVSRYSADLKAYEDS